MSGASALLFRGMPPLTAKPTGRFSTAGPLAVRLQTCETGTQFFREVPGVATAWMTLVDLEFNPLALRKFSQATLEGKTK
jgi:hypothetical protein